MQARLLGWAGVELREAASTLVIDPLGDVDALWAPAGELARGVTAPRIVAPASAGRAVAGLVTHLHRDHADAAALSAALRRGAEVLVPVGVGGDDVEQAGVVQAERELARAGLAVRGMQPWERTEVDGWTVTALPAADGTGDPQVSWLVQRGDDAVVHAGDTLMHGWWWRIARRAARPISVAFLPINAARVRFPHRRPASPLPAVMGAEEAVIAAGILRAGRLVAIHFGAYDLPPLYVSDPDAFARLRRAAGEHAIAVEVPDLGAWFDVAPPKAA